MSVTTRLFDADGTDDEVDLDASVIKRLGDRQLLWVDIHGEEEAELRTLAEHVGLSRQSLSNLSNPIGRPHFDVADGYFEMNVAALDEGEPVVSRHNCRFQLGGNHPSRARSFHRRVPRAVGV